MQLFQIWFKKKKVANFDYSDAQMLNYKIFIKKKGLEKGTIG